MIAMRLLTAVVIAWAFTGVSVRAEDHAQEVTAACRHILSPAMATMHPEFERKLFEECKDRQMRVKSRLDYSEYK